MTRVVKRLLALPDDAPDFNFTIGVLTIFGIGLALLLYVDWREEFDWLVPVIGVALGNTVFLMVKIAQWHIRNGWRKFGVLILLRHFISDLNKHEVKNA